MTIETRVKQLIADQVDMDMSRITDDATIFSDLGADSLDAIELVMRAEEEFGIEISHDEADGLKTVGDLVALVMGKVA